MALQLAFDFTITVEEVLLPKHDPELYLLTARKIGGGTGNLCGDR